MKATKIHHVGIIVADLEKAKQVFGDILGMEFEHEESSEVWNVKAAFFVCGESYIELMQPIGPGIDQDFLDETGGGIHHICYEMDGEAMTVYTEMAKHFRLQSDEPLPGNHGSKIFFFEKEDMFNIETELLMMK